MQCHLLPINKAVQTFSVSEAYFAPHFTIRTLDSVSVEVMYFYFFFSLQPSPIYMHKHQSFCLSVPPLPAFCYIGVKNVKQKNLLNTVVCESGRTGKTYSTYVWGLGTGDGWREGGKRGCSSVLYYTDSTRRARGHWFGDLLKVLLFYSLVPRRFSVNFYGMQKGILFWFIFVFCFFCKAWIESTSYTWASILKRKKNLKKKNDNKK